MVKKGYSLVFIEAEDSAEGLVEVATREKVYKCLAVCYGKLAGKVKICYSTECACRNIIFLTKNFAYFEINCCFLLPNDVMNSARDNFQNGPLR